MGVQLLLWQIPHTLAVYQRISLEFDFEKQCSCLLCTLPCPRRWELLGCLPFVYLGGLLILFSFLKERFPRPRSINIVIKVFRQCLTFESSIPTVPACMKFQHRVWFRRYAHLNFPQIRWTCSWRPQKNIWDIPIRISLMFSWLDFITDNSLYKPYRGSA